MAPGDSLLFLSCLACVKKYIYSWHPGFQRFTALTPYTQYYGIESRTLRAGKCFPEDVSAHTLFFKTSSLCGLLYKKYGSHIRQVSQLYKKYGSHIRQVSQNLTNALLNKENSIPCSKILQNGKKVFYSRKHCKS